MAKDKKNSCSVKTIATRQYLLHYILLLMLKSKSNCIFATMLLQGKQVDFQLDTGAETNTISIDFVDQRMIRLAL